MLIHTLKEYAEKPAVIIPSIVLGICCGIFLPAYTSYYTTISQVYLTLLEMCVLPVMSTVIISSLGHLIHGGKTTFYLKRMMSVFVISLLLAALVAFLMSLILSPGAHLSDRAVTGISKTLLNLQGQVVNLGTRSESMTLADFLSNLIPNNIFTALSQGKSLSILFVGVLVGIAIGLQKNETAKHTLNVMHSIYDSLYRNYPLGNDWSACGLVFPFCKLYFYRRI